MNDETLKKINDYIKKNSLEDILCCGHNSVLYKFGEYTIFLIKNNKCLKNFSIYDAAYVARNYNLINFISYTTIPNDIENYFNFILEIIPRQIKQYKINSLITLINKI